MLWCFGHEACGILVLWSGIEPVTHALEGKVLTTRLLGKSLAFFLDCCHIFILFAIFWALRDAAAHGYGCSIDNCMF